MKENLGRPIVENVDYDRGSGPYQDGKPVTPFDTQQRVLNESWPYSDSKGRHARNIDDQPAERQLQVTVRVILEHDGEVFLPGRATRWNRSHVYVRVNDLRVPQRAVWVRAHDVRRRAT